MNFHKPSDLPRQKMLNAHWCIKRSLLNMEVEYCLPEIQVGACSHSPGVCSTFCRGVQMCHPLIELGSLHEMAGSLSPVLRENIKSRIIRLRTQIHRQIFLHIYWYSQWTGKKKTLEIKNDVVLYSSRTRGSEFHSFCWEFIFLWLLLAYTCWASLLSLTQRTLLKKFPSLALFKLEKIS